MKHTRRRDFIAEFLTKYMYNYSTIVEMIHTDK